MNADHYEVIIDVLVPKLAPVVVYVFGSYAKGIERQTSDIDIAYLSDTQLEDYDRFMLAQRIAGDLNISVDLIDLTKASTVFQTQVISKGKSIYCKDEVERMKFEMLTLKMYAKLNEERKVVLDKILESGEVFER
ncbi:MAG: nucleotidyltransferase domain-containing protein [Bacillaceae bacterium]|nr:nucleotidyltransferase domain-containing protein [Bacillaceae bacterium]